MYKSENQMISFYEKVLPARQKKCYEEKINKINTETDFKIKQLEYKKSSFILEVNKNEIKDGDATPMTSG